MQNWTRCTKNDIIRKLGALSAPNEIILIRKRDMDKVRVIEIKKSVFEDNDRDADRLRTELRDKGIYLLNLMSSPGSGKTTTLIQTINKIKDKLKVAVMEADIDSDVDAKKILEAT